METTTYEQTPKSSTKVQVRSETGRLDSEARKGWAGFLSSIATSESVERLVVEPLLAHFQNAPEIRELIETQAADETRHYQMFSDYVQKHFGYRKTHKTLTDRVVYGGFLPLIAAIGRRRPLSILLVLRFYETFSIEIYRELKKLAEQNGMTVLRELIESVERDEWRHLAGLKKMSGGNVPWLDRAAAHAIALVLRFDVHAGLWAIHNKKLRKNLLRIGLDPEYVNQAARLAQRKTLALAKQQE
ncbi:MAG: ferritin-like domain-containing protein [Bdellovibrionia bacterium]